MTTRPDSDQRLGASFRDPSGFLFSRGGVLFRQGNQVYPEHYDQFCCSKLYAKLVYAGLLIPHEEVSVEPEEPASASICKLKYRTLMVCGIIVVKIERFIPVLQPSSRSPSRA